MEEDKVIEYYKDYAEILNNEFILYGHIKTLKVDYKKLKTLVNLIQKQDTEINKLNNVIDLMSRAILIYDDQLVINHYRDKKHVKETFTEYAMKEDK